MVFRVLCPVDSIEAVTRLSSVEGGTRIYFDVASAAPFPSDRVVLFSAFLSAPSCHPLTNTNTTTTASTSSVACSLPLLHTAASKICPRPLPPSTGAHIQVFAKDRAFPAFTGAPQELLTISGTFTAVRNALVAIYTFLLDIAPSAAPTVPPPPTCITTQMLLPYQYLPFLTDNNAADLSYIKQMSGANLTAEDNRKCDYFRYS